MSVKRFVDFKINGIEKTVLMDLPEPFFSGNVQDCDNVFILELFIFPELGRHLATIQENFKEKRTTEVTYEEYVRYCRLADVTPPITIPDQVRNTPSIPNNPFLNIASAAIAYQEQGGISFSAMTHYTCNYCGQEKIYGSTPAPIFCSDCTDKLKKDIKKMRGIE